MTDRESHERNTAIYRPAIQEYNIRYNRLCPREYIYTYIHVSSMHSAHACERFINVHNIPQWANPTTVRRAYY